MGILRQLSTKLAISAGAILMLVGSLSTAPHTWFFYHEESCPEELLKDK